MQPGGEMQPEGEVQLGGEMQPGGEMLPDGEMQPGERYHFVEEPLAEFYCPVSSNLLLTPHITECCDKHISQEAADDLKREEKPCPLCNHEKLSTEFDDNFLQQVLELTVFCHNKKEGCEWVAELATLEDHIQHCSKCLPESREIGMDNSVLFTTLTWLCIYGLLKVIAWTKEYILIFQNMK